MKEFILTDIPTENAILIGLITPEQNEFKITEYLDELAFLADTDGIRATKRFVQRLEAPHPVTFVGSGKLQEIKDYVENEENEISLAIFDDELSPKQLRNLEASLKIRIMDRTSLILDIFARRAQTAHAKTQVELAQYNYMLPRLKRLWTHLERQSGGGSSGFRMRGPGETQLETDRRIILNKISKLKEDLKEIEKQKSLQRKNRGKTVRVALVGYTNVGKSTLMNLLSKSEVFAENKLFATLDTTVRKVTVDNLAFLLTDTVGFIRKLPTELIESFKSTLDEVREADILMHVVDISHPAFEDQIETVNATLNDITKNSGGEEKPMIIVFNKIDAFSYIEKEKDDLTPRTKANHSLEELKQSWMAKLHENCVFISAKERQNLDELKTLLYDRVRHLHVQRFPYNDFLFHHYDELMEI
ncbi:MAG: GTPase HflX [Dysgonamonadaceae bacterium]|jgi:GTP-binding protein HflX|nr:GTPase HflX [Dysgonamonadaceae bacterium]